MDYVNDGPVTLFFFGGALTSVMAIFLLIGILFASTKKEGLLIVGSAVGLGAVACALITIGNSFDVSREAYAEDIRTLYGLDVSESKLTQLDFPKQKPGDESEFYGTATLLGKDGAEIKKVEVTLGWDGEKFLLYSTGEENTITPLPIKEEQRT